MLRTLKIAGFALIAIACCFFLPSLAFAQGPLPAAPPALSVGVVVVTLLSVLAGVVTQAQQSGKFFGQFVVPGSVMIGLTLAAPFLGGMSAYLASVSFSSAALFWGAVAGITNVIAASASGIAVHAAIVVPAHVAAIRAAKLAKLTVSAMAALGFVVLTTACSWLNANAPVLTADGEQLAACIVAQALAGNTSAANIGTKCLAPAGFDVLGFIATILTNLSSGDAGMSGVPAGSTKDAVIAALKAVHG